MIAHVTPWGVHCGIAKHLSYWVPHARSEAVICAEHPPVWHTRVENWNTFPSYRCWHRGAVDSLMDAARVAYEIGARVLHLQWDPSFFPFQTLAEYEAWSAAHGIRTVITAHTLADDDLYTWENKAILRIADALCVGTPGMAQAFADYARRFSIALRRPPVWVPLPAPDVGRPPAADAVPAARAPRPLIIATWGFLGGHKGHAEVLSAVRMLRRYDPAARYVVAGRAMTIEQEHTLRLLRAEAARDPGLVEIREGFLSDADVIALCRSADCVVLNHQARNQSSSGTVVLSVASGAPVVVSGSPMFSGYVEAGAVRVAAPGAAGIADAVLDVLTGPDTLSAGRAEMMRRADPRTVAAQYEAIYHELEAA